MDGLAYRSLFLRSGRHLLLRLDRRKSRSAIKSCIGAKAENIHGGANTPTSLLAYQRSISLLHEVSSLSGVDMDINVKMKHDALLLPPLQCLVL